MSSGTLRQILSKPSPALLWNGVLVFCVVCFLLIGEWSPVRLKEGGQAGVRDSLFEPRLWLTLILLAGVYSKRHFLPLPANAVKSLTSPYQRQHWVMQVCFLCYMILSTLWAPDWSLALPKGYNLLLLLVVIFAFGLVLWQRDLGDVHYWFWLFLVGLGLVLCLAALKSMDFGASSRLTALGGGSNSFGAAMVLATFGVLHFWQRVKGYRGLVIIGLSVLFFSMVLMSGSRGSLLSGVVGLLVYLAFNLHSPRKLLIALLSSLIGILLLLQTPLGSYARRVFEHRVLYLSLQQGYSSYRDELAKRALQIARQYPVAGVGLAGFTALGEGVYAHNVFLETLAEGGLTGLAILGLSLAYWLASLWRNRRALDSASIAAAFAVLVHCQFSGDLYDTRRFLIVAMLALVPSVMSTRTGANAVRRDSQKAPEEL